MAETLPNFDRLLGFIVADLSRLLRKEFDRRARSSGLTRSQWLVIYYVARHEGCTQSELAEILQFEKITISRQAERLEKAEWLERRDDPSDRRAYHLYLRPKAHRAIARLSSMSEHFREDYFKGLPAERREALLDDLLLVKRNLTGMDCRAKNNPLS